MPRDVLARLHYYHIKEDAMRAVRNNHQMNGQYAGLFTDLSQATIQHRKKLLTVTKALRNHNITYIWGTPSKLTATYQDKTFNIHSLEYSSCRQTGGWKAWTYKNSERLILISKSGNRWKNSLNNATIVVQEQFPYRHVGVEWSPLDDKQLRLPLDTFFLFCFVDKTSSLIFICFLSLTCCSPYLISWTQNERIIILLYYIIYIILFYCILTVEDSVFLYCKHNI